MAFKINLFQTACRGPPVVYFPCILFTTRRICLPPLPPHWLIVLFPMSLPLVSVSHMLASCPRPAESAGLYSVSAVVWEADPVSLVPAAGASYAHGFFICGCLGINVLFLPPQIETIDQRVFSPLLISSRFSLCCRCTCVKCFWPIRGFFFSSFFFNSSVASTLSCLVFVWNGEMDQCRSTIIQRLNHFKPGANTTPQNKIILTHFVCTLLFMFGSAIAARLGSHLII